MNERIKELAIKAGGGPSKWYTDPDVLEYFAELIVQECARVCSEQRDPSNLNYKPSERFAEEIKMHFGVE